MGTPVIGTLYNNTYPLYKFLNVEGSTLTNKDWIRWDEEKVIAKYVEGIAKYFKECEKKNVSDECKNYLNDFDYNAYSNQVIEIFKRKKS